MTHRITMRIRRHKRVRGKIFGTKAKPRMSVFRSNRHIFVQLIDDGAEKTIIGMGDKDLKKGKNTKKELAGILGEAIAKKAIDNKINKAVFDRGGYAYHGIVKEVAEGARRGGLQF